MTSIPKKFTFITVTDKSKIGTHDFRLKVYYENNPDTNAQKDFRLEVLDVCLIAIIKIDEPFNVFKDPNTDTSISHTIGE